MRKDSIIPDNGSDDEDEDKEQEIKMRRQRQEEKKRARERRERQLAREHQERQIQFQQQEQQRWFQNRKLADDETVETFLICDGCDLQCSLSPSLSDWLTAALASSRAITASLCPR